MGFEKDEASTFSNVLRVPREDTPLMSNNENHLFSRPKTFANVFIAIVGAGVLGLPYTFKKIGWLTGVLIIYSVGFPTYHCMMLLVYTHRRLETVLKFPKISSFGDLGFALYDPHQVAKNQGAPRLQITKLGRGISPLLVAGISRRQSGDEEDGAKLRFSSD
ncbi:amino acid transporter AVT3B-like [Forsythia ovata]|uniref:Amino acid transporter AVT3B-like n=1 Tax=Forsythia ovata TaxID=205694 RepID=A0ABD1WTQ9_9LAMI